jgi:hypothetical protein
MEEGYLKIVMLLFFGVLGQNTAAL